MKGIHQQFHTPKGSMTEQESSALCREALSLFMAYFAGIEENIFKSMQNQTSDEINRTQAILNGSSSQFFDFMKDVLTSQHFTVYTEKIERSISSTRASLKVMHDKISANIQTTEDEIAAFDKIIASQMRKRELLKEKLDSLYKAKAKVNAGQMPDHLPL